MSKNTSPEALFDDWRVDKTDMSSQTHFHPENFYMHKLLPNGFKPCDCFKNLKLQK